MEEVAIIADSKGRGYGFAKGVYDYIRSKDERDFPMSLIDIKEFEFKDKEFKVKIANNIRGKRCFLIHDSNKEPAKWFTELNFILEAMRFSSPVEINAVLPYLLFARQDRKDESRVGVNAKVVAKAVSQYATRGMSVDLHAPQIQEYFDIPFDNLYSLPSVISYIQQKHPACLENLVVVSPDAGGGKRVEAFVKRLARRGIKADIAFAHKFRERENEVNSTTIIGYVKDKNCLVVDDIIDTGNTMVKTAEALRENGAKRIYGYGSHGIFTEGKEKFRVFDVVMTSDTLKNTQRGNLEVVSLVNLFGEAVYRTVTGKSLSELFE